MERQPASSPAVDAGLQIVIRTLGPDELDAAAALLAAGMRDNPLHEKVFGGDPQRRQQRLQRFLGQLLAHVHANGTLLGACVHGELIGVLGVMKPGRCRPRRRDVLRMAGAIIASNPPPGVWRIHRWLSTWARNDPPGPHAHIGPLAVSRAWRRQGVGRELMMQCCGRLDALGEVAWLETDLAINVIFYETLGFVVARHEQVLGVPTWYMRREGNVANENGSESLFACDSDSEPLTSYRSTALSSYHAQFDERHPLAHAGRCCRTRPAQTALATGYGLQP